MNNPIITTERAIQLISEEKKNRLSVGERESILLDWWNLDEDDSEFYELGAELQTELLHDDMPGNVLDSKYDKLIEIALAQELYGIKNSYLEKELKDLGIGSFKVKGETKQLEKCPCCDLLTLKSKEGFEVCPACNWEYTGEEISIYSPPNHMTLKEGKSKLSKEVILKANNKWKKYCPHVEKG